MTAKRILLIALLIGLGALVYWIAANTYWDEVTVPSGFRGEALTNPFYAAQRLADELGARPQRRRNLGTMPSTQAAILLSSWHWSLIEKRQRQLERWVEAGGDLIVDRSLIGESDDFAEWSGVERHSLQRQKVIESDGEGEQLDAAESLSTCFELKHAAGAARAEKRDTYTVCHLDRSTRLTAKRRPSWELRDEWGSQVLRMPVGKGSVTVVNGSPFSNAALLNEDHAALFVRATQLYPGREIYFLSEEERESLLALMWRYGAPSLALALAALAFTLWRGAIRLGPLQAPPDPARRSLGEQIRGTGQFTLRYGGGRALHAATVRALHEAAQRHILHYSRMSADDRVGALARVAGIDRDALAEALNYSGPRRPTELRHTVEMLETARRRVMKPGVGIRDKGWECKPDLSNRRHSK